MTDDNHNADPSTQCKERRNCFYGIDHTAG